MNVTKPFSLHDWIGRIVSTTFKVNGLGLYLFNVTDSILTGWTFAKLHSVTYVRLLDKEKKQKFLQQLILEGDNTKYTAYT